MTRYHCTNCDIDFEDERTAVRCPQCLRQHGIEAADTRRPAAPPSGARRPWLLLALGLCLAGLAGGGGLWVYRRATNLPSPGAIGPLDPATLRRTLAHRGVSGEGLIDPFAPGDGIRKLADAKEADPAKKAAVLAARVAARLTSAHLVLDLEGTADAQPKTAREAGEPRLGAKRSAQPKTARTAVELQRLLDPKQKPAAKAVTSLELAIHTVAVLRTAGLRAIVAQVTRLKGAKVATAEIAGGIGRYVAAVYGATGPMDQKPLVVLDPARALSLPDWAGGGDDPTMKALRCSKPGCLIPLDDASAVAHLLALRAYQLRTSEPERAYQLSDMALRAAAPSPTLHLIHAKVLAAAGGGQDSLQEAQKALGIRDGPAQRTLVALALAGQGEAGSAISHLEQALQQDPGYWPAHQALATLLLPVDATRGLTYLRAGLAVAPRAPALLMLEASRLMAEDQTDEAIRLLEQVVAEQPSEYAMLMLYQALRRAGDSARGADALRERLLRLTRDAKRMKQVLEAIDGAAGATSSPTSNPTMPPAPPRLTLPDVSLKK